jgi:hypothetical protein
LSFDLAYFANFARDKAGFGYRIVFFGNGDEHDRNRWHTDHYRRYHPARR